MIYLDYAATMPMRQQAIEAMQPYFADCAANAGAAHGAGREARRAVDRARASVAQALNADPSELFWTSGGTESDNWALFGTAKAQPERRHIIVSAIEHHAVLHPAEALQDMGFEVTLIRPDGEGIVSAEAVKAALRSDTLLVSVMTANNEVGTLQPIAEIAAAAHECGALMHTDAVQAVGHVPVDVRATGVDLLSFSAHKFGGPKGVGGLYVRRGTRIAPLLYGGAQERGLRSGTENVPGIVGTAAALGEAVGAMPQESARIAALRDLLMERILEECAFARVSGSLERRLPGNLHLTFEGVDQDALLLRLDLAGVMASAGSACTSGIRERSHVIRAMGKDGEGEADLRLSLGSRTTEEECLEAAGIIADAAKDLRKKV
ncbi:MAG: cysteine desulfurase [Clostridia bacterium]|nr:cysteine desulfurase [Clostridia bacterium]